MSHTHKQFAAAERPPRRTGSGPVLMSGALAALFVAMSSVPAAHADDDDDTGASTLAEGLSSKLQAARAARVGAVASAKLKMDALVDNARKNGGKATGAAATWVRQTFHREPTTPFLMHLNGHLSVGLLDAKNWIERPKPRPPCQSSTRLVENSAVAVRGGDTIYVCDLFYTESPDENVFTLFHEAQHLHGEGDCPNPVTPATPPDQLLCAGRYEALLRYLWKEEP